VVDLGWLRHRWYWIIKLVASFFFGIH